jgi:predicted methyltransferase
MKKFLVAALGAGLLAACATATQSGKTPSQFNGAKLRTILAAQDEVTQARYIHRHPYETLEFFRVAPGSTVVEFLPGEGWYTKILLPYLGPQGRLIGADYPGAMWPNFPFGDQAFIDKRRAWPQEWTAQMRAAVGDSAAAVEAYALDGLPEGLYGQVDLVLIVRALHNLARFESQGQFLSQAMDTTYKLLKSGGLVGIVQHAADESADDAWADGSHGYLKPSHVKKIMADAGFELVAESEINRNPKDQPGPQDAVWRLPPSLGTSRDNPELAEKMRAIGESNRMTLLFRKPL